MTMEKWGPCLTCKGEGKTYKEETHSNEIRDPLPPFQFKKVTTKIRRSLVCPHCDGTGQHPSARDRAFQEIDAYEAVKEERLQKYYQDEDNRQHEQYLKSLNDIDKGYW